MAAGASDGARVAAIVLAAGAGRRVGEPKAGLLAGGVPLVERVARAFAEGGADPVIVVLGADAERLRGLVPKPAITVINPAFERGQSSSLRVGLDLLPPDATAFLVHPVDHAYVTATDVRRLLAAFRDASAPERGIFRPVHFPDRFGHPVLYGRAFVEEFRKLDAGTPAREIYRRERERVVLVPVANPWIADDVDLPEDVREMERRFGGPPN